MTRRDKHPSADQLASLAVGELRPRKAAKIQAHVAHCEQCTGVCQQFNAIAAILASVSYPPIPENLSARIALAISNEARQRLAAIPATEVGRRDLPARRPRAGAGGGWHLPRLSTAATQLAAAAGAVVIAAAASYLVADNASTSVTRSASSPLAGAAASAQQMSLGPVVTYGQPGSLYTIRAVESHTNFVAAHLRTEAISAVHAAEAREAFAARPSASTAAALTASAADPAAAGPSARRLAGCIGLIAPGQTILVIDIARYQGKPAAVIVTAATVVSEAEAWVVGVLLCDDEGRAHSGCAGQRIAVAGLAVRMRLYDVAPGVPPALLARLPGPAGSGGRAGLLSRRRSRACRGLSQGDTDARPVSTRLIFDAQHSSRPAASSQVAVTHSSNLAPGDSRLSVEKFGRRGLDSFADLDQWDSHRIEYEAVNSRLNIHSHWPSR